MCAVQEQATKRPLVIIAGFIHDVASFMDEHPGGRHLLTKHIGKDATTAFFGGVYDHSNAAHNVSIFSPITLTHPAHTFVQQLLSMMRVGVLHGGHQHGLQDKAIPPSQRLRVARSDYL